MQSAVKQYPWNCIHNRVADKQRHNFSKHTSDIVKQQEAVGDLGVENTVILNAMKTVFKHLPII